ncbi:MAG: hypothetical protein RI955_1513 [Bacteroidota bacterium]
MKNIKYLLVGLFALIATYFSYMVKAENTLPVFVCYATLFAIYFYLLKILDNEDVQWVIYSALFIRFILLGAIPNLTEDVYRYLWDGNMQAMGFNPYTLTPKDVMDGGMNHFKNAGNLFHQIHSIRDLSAFAPLTEALFYISIKASLGHQHIAIIFIKFMLFIAEVFTISALLNLLKHFNLPAKNIFIYALSPLAIIEISGNAHTEAVMICMLLLAFQYYVLHKNKRAVIFYALSIASGLLPLFLLPIFLLRNTIKQNLKFSISLAVCLFLFFGLYFQNRDILHTYSLSLQSYYNEFEFNSLFYFWLDKFLPVGSKHIAIGIISRLFTATSFFVLLFLSWRNRKKELASIIPIVQIFMGLFFILFPVLNPWYLLPMVMLCVFIPWQSVLLWSALCVASALALHTINNDYLHVIASIFCLLIPIIWFLKDRKTFIHPPIQIVS